MQPHLPGADLGEIVFANEEREDNRTDDHRPRNRRGDDSPAQDDVEQADIRAAEFLELMFEAGMKASEQTWPGRRARAAVALAVHDHVDQDRHQRSRQYV